jgi:hypothetical protein
MTTIHPRRALAEAEAAAWLELHADWCRGLPAEVRDTTVTGELFHPLIGDGWTTQSWHQAPRPESRRFRAAGTCERDGRTYRIERMVEAPAARRAPVRDCSTSGPLPTTSGRLPMPVAGEPAPLRGRALRAVACEDTEQLRPVTVVMGERVPVGLQFRSVPVAGMTGSGEGFAYRRRAGATQAFADLSGHADTSWMDQLAAAELLGWLQAEHGLTDREAEALRRHADGCAQPTRSARETFQRARRRALAALSACPEMAEHVRPTIDRPLPATGADFGCSPARALALLEEQGWQRLRRRSSYDEYRAWARARAAA